MDTQPRSVYNITFVITMDLAFKLLTDGLLAADEYRRFLDEMNEKYDSEEVRVLYQSKLDIYLEQSVNVDTKGARNCGSH